MKNKIEKFLEFFNIYGPEINISDQDQTIKISLKIEEDAGFLIGKEGATLKELEHILRLVLTEKNEEERPKRIILDINNYKKAQEERLREIARKTAHEVIITKKPSRLPGYNSYERMVIHTELATNPNIITESEGERDNRCLVIKIYP